MKLMLKCLVPLAVGLVCVCPTAASTQGVPLGQPILITSAGQNADVTIVGMVFRKLGLPFKAAPLATAADLAGHQTLVLVPGFSSKGLGSAGVNREQELERVKAVIAGAQQAGMKVVVLHIGGKARRGGQSDEFCRMAVAAANHLVVVRTGDDDQFFSKLAAERKLPIELVDRMADISAPVGRLFK